MAPETLSNEMPASGSVPAAAPSYRSNQRSQQIRFPSRRTIVKRYGRRSTARSPKQQTLTQAGYAVSPQPYSELRDNNVFGLDQEGNASMVAVRAESVETCPTPPSMAGRITAKKRKLQRGAYHTQTLTQFVAKHAPFESSDGDAADGLPVTIRDSDDEDIFASPTTQAKALSTPKQKKGQSPKPVVSTPMARRTEIPSSQPSPFTPVVLAGRYYSPVGSQHSSPLSYKKPGLDNVAKRSARQRNSDNTAPVATTPHGSRAWDGPLDRGPGRPASLSASKEIPDSDEEDGDYSGPLILGQRGEASRPQTAVGDVDAKHDTASLLSSPPSSPRSCKSTAQSVSVTPRAIQMRNAVSEAGGSQAGDTLKKRLSPGRASGASILPTSPDSRRKATVLNSDHPSQSPTADSHDGYGTHGSQQQYSQGFESQRVPLEVIRMMAPQTDRSDIIISIHPEQIRKIVAGAKDHEFRSFKIPHTVSRFWIYATRPVCELQYMAAVAAGFRQPGEIDSKSGIGNADFNAGRLVAKFAYKLTQVYQLNNPVPLDVMKKNGWAGPPRRYDYLPPAVVGALLGNLRCALFEDVGGIDLEEPGLVEPGTGDQDVDQQGPRYFPKEDAELSISQEIEAQLLSDISETQASQNLQPRTLSGSEARATMPDALLDMSHVAWPSQATTATVTVTQGTPDKQRPPSQEADVALDANFAMPLPELDLDGSSSPCAKAGSGNRTDAACVSPARFEQGSDPSAAESAPQWPGAAQESHGKEKARRRRPVLQTTTESSTESTQAALPDSLYEEVRQAPPAVILDSEESDNEE